MASHIGAMIRVCADLGDEKLVSTHYRQVVGRSGLLTDARDAGECVAVCLENVVPREREAAAAVIEYLANSDDDELGEERGLWLILLNAAKGYLAYWERHDEHAKRLADRSNARKNGEQSH